LCLIAEELGRQLCAMPLAPCAAAALALAASKSTRHLQCLEALMRGENLVLPALRSGNARLALARDAAGAWKVSGRCDGIPAASARALSSKPRQGGTHRVLHGRQGQGPEMKPARAADGTALACLRLRNLPVPDEAIVASGAAAGALAAK